MGIIKAAQRLGALIWSAINTSGTVITTIGAAGGIAVVWGVFWTWAQQLDQVQIGLFSFATLCFFVVLVNRLTSWWAKRRVDGIPDLIEQLDRMTLDYINDYSYQMSMGDWKTFVTEYGTLIGTDVRRFVMAVEGQKQDDLDVEFGRLSKAYGHRISPQSNKWAGAIGDLRDAAGLLNKYNIGLKALRETPQYATVYKDIKRRQRQLPSASISAKVNEYFLLSEGYYCSLIIMKPLLEPPNGVKMPTQTFAKREQVRPVVEGQIASLIVAIRESITAYKERNLVQNKKD